MVELFAPLPQSFVFAALFLLGIIIGSFLNVVLYRFHTGKSLKGRSHCLSCGTHLHSPELVPLISYLVLKGRCRTCRAIIPARYFLVEMMTGLLFVLAGYIATSFFSFGLLLFFMTTLVLIVVYDLYHFIIPDEFVLMLTVVVMLLAGEQLLLTGDTQAFFLNLLGASLASFFFFCLWHYSEGKWLGFGDVKLAFPLALFVTLSSVFSMIVLSFWVGAIIGVTLLLWQTIRARYKGLRKRSSRSLSMKSAIPFAPFLVAGTLLAGAAHINVVSLLTYAG